VETSGVSQVFGPVAQGVEVCRRVGNGRVIFILLNHGQAPAQVVLPRTMRDLLNGNADVSTVTLPVEGVAVLEERQE
jgi:beta-galactosidase